MSGTSVCLYLVCCSSKPTSDLFGGSVLGHLTALTSVTVVSESRIIIGILLPQILKHNPLKTQAVCYWLQDHQRETPYTRPLSAYVGEGTQINSANAVRAQFRPLIDIAREPVLHFQSFVFVFILIIMIRTLQKRSQHRLRFLVNDTQKCHKSVIYYW